MEPVEPGVQAPHLRLPNPPLKKRRKRERKGEKRWKREMKEKERIRNGKLEKNVNEIISKEKGIYT